MGSVPRLADPAAAIEARTAREPLLTAPFAWFGGKRRISRLVWERFGDVPNYIEPFAGSLAVLLGRPHVAGLECVNDRDAYISNFWRAVAAAPDLVAWHADWPVSETDLHARHAWLCSNHAFRERMNADPEYFDPKVAGWWVWGLAQWNGAGWCDRPEWQGRGVAYRAPRGIQAQGIRADIYRYFDQLGARLRDVRVSCGDWGRVLKPSPTTREGVTGVLLDPPYGGDRYAVYSQDSMFLHHEVAEWAIRHGADPRFRIALCGLEGDYELPAGWSCAAWKRRGGHANAAISRSRARGDVDRERVWFSPFCINPAAQ